MIVLLLILGIFSVCGIVKWKGEVYILFNKIDKMVCDGILIDSLGFILVLIWGECIILIEELKFYNIINCRFCYFYGKCLIIMFILKILLVEE